MLPTTMALCLLWRKGSFLFSFSARLLPTLKKVLGFKKKKANYIIKKQGSKKGEKFFNKQINNKTVVFFF
jgi:hypothetical protein